MAELEEWSKVLQPGAIFARANPNQPNSTRQEWRRPQSCGPAAAAATTLEQGYGNGCGNRDELTIVIAGVFVSPDACDDPDAGLRSCRNVMRC